MKKKITFTVLSIVLVLTLALVLTGCSLGAKPAAAPTAVAPTLLERVATSESRLNKVEDDNKTQATSLTTLQGQLSNIPNTQTLSNIQQSLTGLTTRIDNLKVPDTSTFVLKSEIANLALKSDLANYQLKSDVNTNYISNTKYNTDITALQNQIDVLKTAIATPIPVSNPTGTGSTGTTSTMGKVTIKVTSYNGTIIPMNTYDFAGNTYGIGNVTISSGGSGYTSVPAVRFTGGIGSGAIAHAVLANEIVTAVIVDDPGSSYLNKPGSIQVSFSGGGNTTVALASVLDMTLTTETLDPTITLKITNGENYDINNLIFDVSLSSDNDITSSNLISKLKLSGTNASFRSTYSDTQEFDFETSGNGINVQAGKTKYVYITPSILLKNAYTDADVSFNVTVRIVDYSS